jgi:hypothetical protein
MTEEITINEFCFEDMPTSCTWIVIGAPTTGVRFAMFIKK